MSFPVLIFQLCSIKLAIFPDTQEMALLSVPKSNAWTSPNMPAVVDAKAAVQGFLSQIIPEILGSLIPQGAWVCIPYTLET